MVDPIRLVEGAGVALAGLAGAVGYFKANVSKATIDLYKEDNNALRGRLDTVEAELKDVKAENQALHSAHQYLTSVITQADAIAALRSVVDRIAAKVGA